MAPFVNVINTIDSKDSPVQNWFLLEKEERTRYFSVNKQVWLDTQQHYNREKIFQDFLNSMSLILNSIPGHSTTLCLKKEAVEL